MVGSQLDPDAAKNIYSFFSLQHLSSSFGSSAATSCQAEELMMVYFLVRGQKI